MFSRQPQPAPDRYVRRGGSSPKIYFGNLRGVEQAIADAKTISAFAGDTQSVFAVYGREQRLVRVFAQGVCTWSPDTGAAST
jgi:hypothetical protein